FPHHAGGLEERFAGHIALGSVWVLERDHQGGGQLDQVAEELVLLEPSLHSVPYGAADQHDLADGGDVDVVVAGVDRLDAEFSGARVPTAAAQGPLGVHRARAVGGQQRAALTGHQVGVRVQPASALVGDSGPLEQSRLVGGRPGAADVVGDQQYLWDGRADVDVAA